jgi:DNA polymerase-3 subunit gamma/tau
VAAAPVAQPAGAAAAVAVAEPPPVAEPVALDPLPVPDLEELVAVWPAVVDVIAAEHAMLAALLRDTRPVALEENAVVIGFAPGAAFLKRKAEGTEQRKLALDALRQVTGVPLGLRYELREDLAAPTGDEGEPLSEEELLARLMAEFDAEELPPDEEEGA